MSKTRRRKPYKGRAPVPAPGGPMRAKQERRRQTRGATQQAWMDEYLDEQAAVQAEMQHISDEAEGRLD